MSFKYNLKNAYQNTVSLHDCKITKIYTEDSDLIIEFGINRFWVITGTEYNNQIKLYVQENRLYGLQMPAMSTRL